MLTVGDLVQSKIDPDMIGIVKVEHPNHTGYKAWIVLWLTGYREGYVSCEKEIHLTKHIEPIGTGDETDKNCPSK